MKRIIYAQLMLVTVVALLLGGCIADTGGAAAPAAPRVYFTTPGDGATATAPVKVVMAADNFVIEPASDSTEEGHGHLHIMVDVPCMDPGLGIPKDDAHLHFGQGQLEAELELPPGEHTLCLQAANGLHVALEGEGMTDTISVIVE